jgi:hypothetical protein
VERGLIEQAINEIAADTDIKRTQGGTEVPD